MMYVIKHTEASNVHHGATLFGPFDSEDDARIWIDLDVATGTDEGLWEWGETDDTGAPTLFWGPYGEYGTVYEIVEPTKVVSE